MAIIVVLAAVAIPTFSRQLETSRETSDMEIIRNAYTEALTMAVQDASDGKFDGKIHDLELSTTAADTGKALAVAFGTAGTNNQSATYIVRIGNMAKGAKFSQNGTEAATSSKANTEFNNTTNKWQYVNNKLYEIEVPPVNTAVGMLTFEFEFDTTNYGEVVPKKTSTNNYLFVTAAS